MLSLLISLNCYIFVMILSPNVYINVNMHSNNMDNFNGPFGVCCALIITMNYHLMERAA